MILIASCVITVIIWLLNQYQLFSAATSLAAIGCWAVSALVLYKANLIDALCLSVDYVILIYVIDFFSISVFGVVFREEQMADIVTGSFSSTRIGFLCLSKGLLFGTYYYLKRCFLYRFPFKNWKAWVAAMSAVGMVSYCIRNTFSGIDANIVFIWFLLLVFVLLGILSVTRYMNMVQEKADMIEEHSAAAEHYEKMIQGYRASQIFQHDLKNQQLVIENYLKSEEYDKAREYMNRLKYTGHMEPMVKRTGIEALDGLLECKKMEAAKTQIEVDIIAEIICLSVEEQDLIALVGNAMDNAIEACRKMKKNHKWIRISIRKIREMTFFKIENSYEEEPEVKDGRFLSKKKNSILHGLGITSMKMTVDKYGGSMGIDYKQGVFTITFSFFN